MDAKRLVLEETFTAAYNIENFTKFIKEFFNNCTLVNKEYKDSWNWSEFNYYINGYTHIGNYIDPNKSKVAIFAVELKKNRSVERARSMQRNFISKLISNANYDAAIVAFYSKDESKWRLSLVRLDYEFAKGRVKAKLTPAKRYSYLVGEKEPCHTAMERLLPIFENDKFNSTLDNIEEAFNVEKVTEDFFKKYKEKYHELKEHLDDNADFNEEAEKHNFTSEQFAKKLMGQLAFLYFLQKKGWLGVKVLPHTINEKQYKNAYYNYNKAARTIVPKVYHQISQDKYAINYELLKGLNDEEANVLAGCFNAEPWGSGTKSFIRDLFNNCIKLQEKEKKNFFDDYLEPLFYEALNHRRGENNYYKRFNCKIPFLNGGLFEPLENYDWQNSKFEIPNDLFSNKNIKGEENADGILDVFNRYNFTMNEDEPLEREVAVDPEMLGKIFENLLDVKDRKSKGAFYTPREIVHYMCQESLINYLVNETKVSYEDLKEFITYGEIMKDEDTSKGVKLGTEEMQIPVEVYKNLKTIDDKLANVSVADPAVGSGAFPMGMISEIVKARNNITAYYASQYTVNNKMSESEKKMQYSQRARVYDIRNPYKLKWDTIKNSIYAVDIEASAVDITKLRLWLSLVVDEELDPTFEEQTLGENKQRDPHPLPNLDYNIMCGNSLIDEFEGIKLFDDSILDKKEHSSEEVETNWQMSLFNDNTEKLLQELFKQQDNLFGEDNTERKSVIKKKIDKTIDDIIRSKLSRDGNADGLEKYEESLKQKTKPYFLWRLEFAKVFKEKGGFDIVIGNPPYIDSENMVNSGMEEMRNIISSKYKLTKGNWDIYIAFFELGFNFLSYNGNLTYITPDKWISKPFGDELRKQLIGNVSSLLNAGRKVFESAKVDAIVTQFTKNAVKDIMVFGYEKGGIRYKRTLSKNILKSPYALDVLFSDSIEILTKLETDSILLGSLYPCENACATSDAYKLKEVITEVNSPENFYSSKYLKIINTGTIDKYVSKWGIQAMTYLKDKYIYPIVERNIFFERFKNTYAQKSIRSKIIIKGLTLLDACLDEIGNVIPGKSTMIIANEDINKLKFLLAIINSKLSFFYIKQKYSSSSYNGGINFTKDMINSLPIKKVSQNDQDRIIELVDKIIKIKSEDRMGDILEYENEINQYIYKWHNLNEEEIKIIEGGVSKKCKILNLKSKKQ